MGLAACGGGGDDAGEGGTPTPTATPLSPANFGNLTASISRNLGFTELIGDLAFAEEGTRSCVGGGTVVGTFNDVIPTGVDSIGDTFTAVATGCIEAIGEAPINANVTIRLDSVTSVDGDGVLSEGTYTVTIGNFQRGDLRISGSVAGAETLALSTLDFRGLTATTASEIVTLNLVATESTTNGSLSIEGNVIVNGSSYRLSTPVRLQPGGSLYSAGTLRVTDGSGGFAELVMSIPSYTVTLFQAGGAMVDSRTVLWTAL